MNLVLITNIRTFHLKHILIIVNIENLLNTTKNREKKRNGRKFRQI